MEKTDSDENKENNKKLNNINVVKLRGYVEIEPEIILLKNRENIAIKLTISTQYITENDKQFHHILILNPYYITMIDEKFKKGDLVDLEGSLVYRKWRDKDNNERKTAQILILLHKNHYIEKI